MGARSGSGHVTLGEIVAGLGGLLLLGSLWRPWYELTFPESLLSQVRAAAPRMGELGGFMSQGVDQLRQAGGIPVTAWQAFEQADLVLAGAAAAALGLILLNAIGALSARMDGAIALAGAIAAAIVLYHLFFPPGSGNPLGADLLHPAPALYAGLAGAAMILAGGLMAMGAAPAGQPVTPAPEALAQRLDPSEVRVWDAS